MARKLRVEYAGAIYPVMNRGDRREQIFVDDADCQRFVETLISCRRFRPIQLPCRIFWFFSTRRVDVSKAATQRFTMPPVRTRPPSRPSWSPEEPFNALPPLPPATAQETRAVLKHWISARTALVELIPNQGVLINTLPLPEAQASSEMENILTTTNRLFQTTFHSRPSGKLSPTCGLQVY